MPQNRLTPIITSLLDTDAYKFYMQQAVFHLYPHTQVVAEFHCRSQNDLGYLLDDIRYQIELMQEIILHPSELAYLASLPYFKPDYLNWLKNFRFNPQQINIENVQGKLKLRIEGSWLEVILWEVPLLALISETVHQRQTPHITEYNATQVLRNKLVILQQKSLDRDMTGFKIMDFGTRRRFSQVVHQQIVQTLKNECAYFIGTSNYLLAKKLNLAPLGTQAHEWFQAHQQLGFPLIDSQQAALQAWLTEYPEFFNIALTDCINMDAFLRDFSFELATHYQGLRHDSGNPIAWGEKAISHYEKWDIDPKTKTLVFSDNLDFDLALNIYDHFHHRINLNFGIGTRLTCDLPGVSPLNIVIKLIKCNDKPVAKLSDSPGKTISSDHTFIKTLQDVFAISTNLTIDKR